MRGKHQSGSQESKGRGFCPKPDNLVIDAPCVCPDLYTLTKAAVFSAGLKLCRIEQEGVQRVGQVLFPKLMLHRGKYSNQERWHLF